MKNYTLKNKLLQLFYKPYKSKINLNGFVDSIEEIEKALEDKNPYDK